MTLFRLAELTGQFEEPPAQLRRIERVIITGVPRHDDEAAAFPASSEANRDEP